VPSEEFRPDVGTRENFVAQAEDMLAKEWEIMKTGAAIGTALRRAALPGEEADA
jgi:hypothetical protein